MLRVAFVLAFGEPRAGFFPDTLLGLLCATARAAGHRAELVRVYYDGRDAARDRQIGARLERWLAEREIDLVVVERLFDPAPLRAHLAGDPARRALLVTRGDSFDPIEGVDLLIGAATRPTSRGSRRTPTPGELVRAFEALLEALQSGRSPRSVPGVSMVEDGALHAQAPSEPATLPRDLRPVLEHDVIALDPPPPIERKTLFGNSGCPFALDPLSASPHYAGLRLPDASLARLGCAFCSMGGDYHKRPDDEVVRELVEQALDLSERAPAVGEIVLADQHAIRYLATLLIEARRAGVRPMRWLFAARADAFVREEERVGEAIAAAEATGHRLEVYLSGFEAFSDRELERYNKGVQVRDLLAAIETMRRLGRAHPDRFEYARARGHSLILWNPWTTPEDLRESVEAVRAHGLSELFDELGRNRLRLYRDLPIYYAAERDGALVERWEGDDEGAGRRKGYNVEQPWRFLDRRTRVAHALAEALRERLGTETELAQLRAVSAPDLPDDPRATLDALDALEGAFETLTESDRGADGPPRGSHIRATAVAFAGACNNGCASCAQGDFWLDDERLLERVDAARASGLPVMLAGREPSLHPRFLEAIERARGEDERPVGVVTNGRRFAYGPFTRAAMAAGLRAASVKLFAPDEDVADRIARDEGAHRQALAGLRALRTNARLGIELRAPMHRENLARFDRFAALARSHRVDVVRVELALDAVGLAQLGAAASALRTLASRCAAEGIALEVSPVRAGTRAFEWLPTPRPRRGPAR